MKLNVALFSNVGVHLVAVGEPTFDVALTKNLSVFFKNSLLDDLNKNLEVNAEPLLNIIPNVAAYSASLGLLIVNFSIGL